MGWRTAAYRAVRPLLFAVDPERIHHLTLSALSLAGATSGGRSLCAVASGASAVDAPIELLGLRFRNRIGLGAGFDKDGVAIRAWAALGFGFVELGTVTARPQSGNPRPRLFRLARDAALVNRMGFNNAGADALARRIDAARPSLPDGFVVGVNLGRNRDTPDGAAAADYAAAARSVASVADYLALNVSSPNTPGVRDLQDPARLGALLAEVRQAAPRPPIIVKLAPDLDDEAFDRILRSVERSAGGGLVLSNTTSTREGLRSANAEKAGGLSGRPLFSGACARVARARRLAGGRLAILASGGIGSAEDAAALLEAGADLVQLWTGMVYAGPGLIGEAVARSARPRRDPSHSTPPTDPMRPC